MQPVRHYSVLIADDSEADRFFLRTALERNAPRLKIVGQLRDGCEVVDYLSGENDYSNRERHPLPDLLIMDSRMPCMGGLDVLKWLKTHPFANLKVAVLADSSGSNLEFRARALGADFFFSKMASLHELPSSPKFCRWYCPIWPVTVREIAQTESKNGGARPPRAQWIAPSRSTRARQTNPPLVPSRAAEVRREAHRTAARAAALSKSFIFVATKGRVPSPRITSPPDNTDTHARAKIIPSRQSPARHRTIHPVCSWREFRVCPSP